MLLILAPAKVRAPDGHVPEPGRSEVSQAADWRGHGLTAVEPRDYN
jgi:hypothetical protein